MDATISSTSAASALPSDVLARLAQKGSVRTFPRHSVLIHEGDDTNSLFVIVTGRVKIYLSDSDGREVTLATQGAGEYVGELVLDGGPRSASVMALEQTQCIVIRHGELQQFITENPEFALHLIHDLMRRTRRLTENVRSLALLDVYGRVAHVLLELAHDVDGHLVVTERLTQQDLANRVGASREMVSRILRDLDRGGYIRQENGRMIIDRPPPARW
jgi:CRP/FNR family cyclic AMP-dependent transcriptional regulator